MIRFFDIVLSLIILIITLPVNLIIAISILLESKGGILYKQVRVGKDDKDFNLLKFRTMYSGSENKSLLTIGNRDKRITRIGYFLRKYKLDEIPQFINVIKGEMSIVGPRPEVRKYTNLYNIDQKKILEMKPGITDFASIKYRNENILLEQQNEPEIFYIRNIMPDKICLNLLIFNNLTIKTYFVVIIQTIKNVFMKSTYLKTKFD